MPANGRTDVFLSYSKVDTPIASDLARALERSGLEIWWDAYLDPSKPFEETVKNVLLNTEVIIGILSLASLQSPWVRWELTQAHEHGLRVVPLLAEGVQQKDLPPPLNKLKALIIDNERSPAAINDTVDAIRRIVSAVRSQPNPESRGLRKARLNIAAERLAEVSIKLDRDSPGVKAIDARDYLCSNGFRNFLQAQNISIAFTSFPLNLLLFICQEGSDSEMLTVSHVPDARGLHADGGKFLVGCETFIAEMVDDPKKIKTIEGDNSHLFVPKIRHMTGNLDIHDIAPLSSNHVLFANTRYSCLSVISPTAPVKVVYQPGFISELAPEDRCHLNGIAIKNGEPGYITAVAETDTIDGWRQRRADGGILIDVARDKVICRGLSMPHSPRFHENRLWILNSGSGELGFIEAPDSGESRFKPLTFLPGFLRGLAFIGPYAIVGLSKPRYEVFEGLPLYDRLMEKGLPPWSGIAVVDTRNGRCVEWFRLTGRVWEVSDVALLSGVNRPMACWDTGDTG